MLEVKNLSLSFKKKQVLKGVTFSLKKGEIVSLIGLNGAGKTTLLECLMGIKKPASGEIIFDNQKDKSLKDIKRSLGYMPQAFRLYNDLTVLDNLKYVAAIYGVVRMQIDKIIEACGLGEMKNVMAERLSGGYRQLLQLAVCFLHRPSLAVLDEPTAAMDPLFRRKFWDIVHKFNASGVTILVISHHIEDVMEAGRVLCLSKGEIVIDEPVEKLTKNSKLNMEKILVSEVEE